MEVCEQINGLSPAGIGKKDAHIIGRGIGRLPAAAFLVEDAHARQQDQAVRPGQVSGLSQCIVTHDHLQSELNW
jgi:hypothetical protein